MRNKFKNKFSILTDLEKFKVKFVNNLISFINLFFNTSFGKTVHYYSAYINVKK